MWGVRSGRGEGGGTRRMCRTFRVRTEQKEDNCHVPPFLLFSTRHKPGARTNSSSIAVSIGAVRFIRSKYHLPHAVHRGRAGVCDAVCSFLRDLDRSLDARLPGAAAGKQSTAIDRQNRSRTPENLLDLSDSRCLPNSDGPPVLRRGLLVAIDGLLQRGQAREGQGCFGAWDVGTEDFQTSNTRNAARFFNSRQR